MFASIRAGLLAALLACAFSVTAIPPAAAQTTGAEKPFSRSDLDDAAVRLEAQIKDLLDLIGPGLLQLDHMLGHPAGDAAVEIVLELLPPIREEGDEHQGVGHMGEELLDHLPEAKQHGPVALQPKALELIEYQDQRLVETAQQADHTQGL